MRDRDQQRDWRNHQDQQGYNQAGDPDENKDRLPLTRHDVDVAQRLRYPDHGGQTDQHDEERTERRTQNVFVDGPHPQHRPLIRHNRTPRLVSPTERRVPSNLKLNPRQTYLDRLTKWPGKGKAVEHAQQNVKTPGVASVPWRLGHW